MKSLLFVFLAVNLIGCGAEHGGTTGNNSLPSLASVSAESVQAFESTVYAFGRANGCVKCHGGSVNPQWLNPDPTIAYSFARPLINLNNPTASTFASYVSNNHCNDSACRDPGKTSSMQDALLQWAAIEINQTTNGLPPSEGTTLPNPPFATLAMAIPTNLPLITSTMSATVRFDLSQLTPPNPKFAGAFLELSLQSYNSVGTTYKVYNPRIVGATGPISINGMHVYVRPAAGTGLGSESLNQGNLWSTLNVVTSGSSPIVSTSLAIPTQSTDDVITVGFADIH